MGGAYRAERELKALASAWLQEGEMAVADWVADADLLEEGRSAWEADRMALESALTEVTSHSPDPR